MHERMAEAADNGKLIAPIPKETIIETLGCRQETRVAIRNFSMRLSKGLFFKSYFTMLAEETLALVRPQMLTCPVEIGNWNDNVTDAALVKETYQDITAWKKTAEERVSRLGTRFPPTAFRTRTFTMPFAFRERRISSNRLRG